MLSLDVVPLAVETGLGFELSNLLAVLVAAWVAGRAAERVGYPGVLGELLAGVLLGPPLLGLLSAGESLAVIGNLGIVLMMLYIGVEIDLDDLRRASRPGLLAAVGGFVVPAVLGYAVVVAFGGSVLAGLFVGISVGVTSLATKSRILVDLDLLDTRIAYVLIAGALVSDTATLIGFAAIIGFVEAGGFDLSGTVQVAGEAAAFFGVSALVGLWVVPRLVREWRRRIGIVDRNVGFGIVVVIGLVFAGMAELAGLHAILGAFVGGMFIRRDLLGERTQHEVEEMLRDVSIGFLAPVFFVTAGFQITFGVFQTDLALLTAVVAVAMVGKILGTALFYLPSGHGWREGMVVGFGMNGRGAVEIVVAGLGLEAGLITPELFTILVFMAITTTATVPVLMTVGVGWLRDRGELARSEERRQAVVIIGAGPVARLLASELSLHRPVRLVDSNPDRCAQARSEGLEVVRGDALDPDTLEDARLGEARTVLALTTNSEVNVLAAQLICDDFHVPHVGVATGASTTPTLLHLLERIGATPLWEAPINLVRWDHLVATGRVTLSRLEVTDPTTWGSTTSSDQLPLMVEREGVVLPRIEVEGPEDDDRVVVLRRTPDRPDRMPWTKLAPEVK